MSNVVVAQDLWKTYSLGKKISVDALRGANLAIAEGEFVSIVGASGSGKSTLLNLIGLLDTPTKGEIVFDGVKASHMSDRLRTAIRSEKVGFIFQTFNLLPALTALGNVEFPMRTVSRQERLDKAARTARAKMYLERVGLGERLYHKPSELSGGQRQRVAIARALVNDPRLILADEPTGNIDSVATDNIVKLLHEINAAGKTIIMVTHDMETTQNTKVLHMKDGRFEEF